MTDADVDAASKALIGWFESQEITPSDSVRVLTICMVAIIHEISVFRGLCPKDGGRIITNIIMEALP